MYRQPPAQHHLVQRNHSADPRNPSPDAGNQGWWRLLSVPGYTGGYMVTQLHNYIYTGPQHFKITLQVILCWFPWRVHLTSLIIKIIKINTCENPIVAINQLPIHICWVNEGTYWYFLTQKWKSLSHQIWYNLLTSKWYHMYWSTIFRWCWPIARLAVLYQQETEITLTNHAHLMLVIIIVPIYFTGFQERRQWSV